MKKYDYVVNFCRKAIGFIMDMDEKSAVVVRMKLSLSKDTICFYAVQNGLDELQEVPESFVNINGPLAILRENMMNGVNDTYIEGPYAELTLV